MLRPYVAHEDPDINAASRFLLKARLHRVRSFLDMDDPDNLPYLRALAKDPARVASVKRVLAYGFTQCGTSLEVVFRSYGIVWDDEDDEKSQTSAIYAPPAPAPQAPVPTAAPGPAAAALSSPQAPCRSIPARPVDYTHFAFE